MTCLPSHAITHPVNVIQKICTGRNATMTHTAPEISIPLLHRIIPRTRQTTGDRILGHQIPIGLCLGGCPHRLVHRIVLSPKIGTTVPLGERFRFIKMNDYSNLLTLGNILTLIHLAPTRAY